MANETEKPAPKEQKAAVDQAREDAKKRLGDIPEKPTSTTHTDPAAFKVALDLHEKKKAEHKAIDDAPVIAPWENPRPGTPRVEVHTATGVGPAK